MKPVDSDKQTLATELDQVHAELRQEAIDFPVDLRNVRPADDEWCASEILGHIAEMHYSYVARAENLIASPGAQLARDMESPERIEAVAAGPTRTLEEALAQLEAARLYALDFLAGVSEEQLAIAGIHQALGPMTVRDVFSRTIVGHARNHLTQLRAAREQIDKS